jgi:hypothetical protein
MHGLLYQVTLVCAVILCCLAGGEGSFTGSWLDLNSVTGQKGMSEHEAVLNNTTVKLNVLLTVHQSTSVH